MLRIPKISTNKSYPMSRQKRWCCQLLDSIRPQVSFLQLQSCESIASNDGQLAAELNIQLLIQAEIELNPGPLICNCWRKFLARYKKAPIVCCHVYGWVHLKCTGLNTPLDYEKSTIFNNPWCTNNIKFANESTDPPHLTLYKLYIQTNSKGAFGSNTVLRRQLK